MSTLTLLLIIFLTLYDGIGSKIKHSKVDQVGKLIDRKAILFIKYFGFMSNRELFPILHKICLKLCGVFLASVAVIVLFGRLPYYSSFGFIFTLLLLIPLTSYKQLKTEIVRTAKFWGEKIAMGTLAIAFFWIVLDQKMFNEITSPFINRLALGANQLQVEIPTFISIMILTLGALSIFYVLYWIVTKGILWISVIPLKYYAKLCFNLNQEQPLKPLYLISKSIILLIVHFLTQAQ